MREKSVGGVLIQGIDPLNGYRRMEWGAFLRDRPGGHFNKTVNGKINEPKPSDYEYPLNVPTRAFFFEIPNRCWEMVASRYNRKISRVFLKQGNFWKWVLEKQIPVVVCETPSKGMRLLSAGYAAIAIPGADSGIRANRLIPELELIATPLREIQICFDDSLSCGTTNTLSVIALAAFFSKANALPTLVTQSQLLLNSDTHHQWALDNL